MSSQILPSWDNRCCGKTCELLDGVHPTVAGHVEMADAWMEGLRKLEIAYVIPPLSIASTTLAGPIAGSDASI